MQRMTSSSRPAIRSILRQYSSAAAASVPVPLNHPQSQSSSFQSFHSPKGYGQPLPSTHPHLLQPGELTPGIQAKEYHQRREKLVEGLDDGSLVVVMGGKVKYMSQNIFYKFRQRSNLWYLTGWEEPDSVLVLEKTSSGGSKGYKMTMFVRPKDPYDESWNGPRSGPDGAREVFGADEACDVAWFSRRLQDLISHSRGPIYIDIPQVSPTSLSSSSSRRSSHPSSSTRSLFDLFSTPSTTPKDDLEGVMQSLQKKDVRCAKREIERLRLIKSRAEVEVMKKAADISCKAHSQVMNHCFTSSHPTEQSLVSQFEHSTSLSGSLRSAYVPVCASGTNALTIHYVQNNQPVRKGDLVMLDAGCEFGGYASDITRTFPSNGKFTSAQSDLYSAVLSVHRQILSLCLDPSSAHSLSLEEIHRRSVELTRGELSRLGFDGKMRRGDLERVLYPHFVGHPLGIDLHDTMSFGRDEKLQPGMVITIEPGIYVPPLPHLPKEFHNLAVRIEDEVHIGATEGDSIVLSANAPKEIIDIEATCNGSF